MNSTPALAAFAAALLASPAAAQRWMDAPLRLDVLPAGFFVDHADFDGDGDEDLLGQFSGDLTWLVNDGQARFALGPELDTDTTNTYSPKAFGDFNGDGWLDVVVAVVSLVNPTGLQFFLGNDGGFDAPLFFPTATSIRSLTAIQLDADPEPELAFFGQQDFPTYAVGWIDIVDGTPVVLSEATADYDFGANDGEAVDVDGDGIPDLVMASQNLIDVWLTSPGGALTPAPTIVTAHGIGTYQDLEAGDIDGDGDRDLVSWTTQTGNTTRVIVLEGTPAGAVERPFDDVDDWLPDRGFLADWDGDGDLDLFGNDLISIGGVYWHQVENVGGLDFPTNRRVQVPFTGFGGGVADFDGDGDPDFLGPSHVFFGNGEFGTLYTGDLSGGPFIGFGSSSSRVVDWEGDGDTDVTVGLSYLVNNGAGNLTTALIAPELPPNFLWSTISAVGDFDGNGGLDFLARLFGPGDMFPFSSYIETRLLVDDGLGGLSDQGSAFGPGVDLGTDNGFLTAAFDADSDGDLDVVRAGEFWPQLPDGTFGLPLPLTDVGLPAILPARYQTLDADGDGEDELLITSGTTLWVVERLPGGALDAFPYFTGFAPQLPATAVDAGGSSDLDLLFGDNASTTLGRPVILRGTPSGFGAPIALPTSPGGVQQVATDDVDGDGRLDLLVGVQETNGRFAVQVRLGLQTDFDYADPVSYYSRNAVAGFVDLDEDGDLDSMSQSPIPSRRFQAPEDGRIEQYGEGIAGSGGAVPILGASGPVRPGSTEASLRVRRGLGGTLALFAVSQDRADLPDLPFPGLTSLVDPNGLLALINLTLTGSGPGQGELDIPIGITPGLAGNTFTHQFFLLDPASPSFLTHTNGLEITYGL